MADTRRGWFRFGSSDRRSRRLGRSRAPGAPAWWRRALLRPESLGMGALFVVSALGLWALASWTRERFIPSAGRVLDDTRLVRAEFEVLDAAATERARELARQRSPHVFVAEAAFFAALEPSLLNLPESLTDAPSLERVAPEIRERFALDEERLDAFRAALEGDGAERWRLAVRELIEHLATVPLLASEAIQVEQQTPSSVVELRVPGRSPARIHISRAVNLSSPGAADEIALLVKRSGFPAGTAPVALARLLHDARPTFAFDEGESQRLAGANAAAISPVRIAYRTDDVLARRNELLTDAKRDLLIQERRAYAERMHPGLRWARRAGMGVGAVFVAGAMGAYLAFLSPWASGGARAKDRSFRRLIAVAGAVLVASFLACVGAALNPGQVWLLATAPSVFLALTLVIGLGQRSALAFSFLQALFVTIALGAGAGVLFTTLAGVGVFAGLLKEVRNRRSLVVAGVLGAGAMGIAAAAAAAIERPPNALRNDLPFDAALAALGGPLVAFIALGVLPLIERAFGVITGMTLIELRDPKQPLLRELAQRAPGTYTHSLTVATLAEAAADEIGADGLHVYVGALYHDIGKMIKPDYFVENQSGGLSRHEKLSPAMSLLVIVGHVKDGLELAREHNLPPSIRHYIESHHGTTLVEYFYERARQAAVESDDAPPEFGYRYPGPKAQTREAAILMLCDAVESASRALAEPNPSRIESLVGAISGMRLTDGQFDECGLTLKELHAIERSVVKSLNSIYHARISYRSTADSGQPRRPKTGPAAAGA